MIKPVGAILKVSDIQKNNSSEQEKKNLVN